MRTQLLAIAATCLARSRTAASQALVAPGSWLDDYGYMMSITQTQVGGFDVVEVDERAFTALVSPGDAGSWAHPYAKIKFACRKDELWYCWYAYGLSDLAAARTAADTTRPHEPHVAGSCGSEFVFSRMIGSACGAVAPAAALVVDAASLTLPLEA